MLRDTVTVKEIHIPGAWAGSDFRISLHCDLKARFPINPVRTEFAIRTGWYYFIVW
jgi:hypothetical protein